MPTDELLKYFIQKTEESGPDLDITFCVNGIIVTGILISSKKYYDIMSNFFEGDSYKILKSGNNGRDKTGTWEQYRRDYKLFIEEIRNKKNSSANDTDYVYLMSGTVFHSGSEFPFGVWKGKTSSIDGFSLGLIQPDNTT